MPTPRHLAPVLSAIFSLAACGGSDDTSEPVINGGEPFYQMFWSFDETSGSPSNLQVTDAEGNELENPWAGLRLGYHHINRLEPQFVSGYAELDLLLAPYEVSGNFEEPGPGFLVVSMDVGEIHPATPTLGARTVVSLPDFPGSSDLPGEANVVYMQTNNEFAPNIEGTISLNTLEIEPDGETYGDISTELSFDDVTMTLSDGSTEVLNGTISASAHKAAPPPPSGGGSGGGSCTGSYEGPNSDPQRDSFCQAAWSAMCNGLDASSYCELYNSSSWSSSGSCPYC